MINDKSFKARLTSTQLGWNEKEAQVNIGLQIISTCRNRSRPTYTHNILCTYATTSNILWTSFLRRYGAIRGGYQHFGAQGGQDSGFPSPRGALGYPFPPMHQNSYSGYHLGSYPPPCSSPPKDGKLHYLQTSFSQTLLSVALRGPITVPLILIADHMSLKLCGPILINFNCPRLKLQLGLPCRKWPSLHVFTSTPKKWNCPVDFPLKCQI